MKTLIRNTADKSIIKFKSRKDKSRKDKPRNLKPNLKYTMRNNILSDWINFSESLFKNSRNMTLDEQKLFNEHKNKIFEII